MIHLNLLPVRIEPISLSSFNKVCKQLNKQIKIQIMKSFKIREGSVIVDGIHYQSVPCDTVVKGKYGRIQSINIGNRGQFFPVFGEFNDGTTPSPVVDEAPTKKVTLSKTELKETSSIPVDVDGKPIKVRKTKSK
jgi:hypothetical protein